MKEIEAGPSAVEDAFFSGVGSRLIAFSAGADLAALPNPQHGAAGELGGRADIQFAFDVLAMRFDGVHADVQTPGDFVGGVSLADHPEDLELPVAQRLTGSQCGGSPRAERPNMTLVILRLR